MQPATTLITRGCHPSSSLIVGSCYVFVHFIYNLREKIYFGGEFVAQREQSSRKERKSLCSFVSLSEIFWPSSPPTKKLSKLSLSLSETLSLSRSLRLSLSKNKSKSLYTHHSLARSNTALFYKRSAYIYIYIYIRTLLSLVYDCSR